MSALRQSGRSRLTQKGHQWRPSTLVRLRLAADGGDMRTHKTLHLMRALVALVVIVLVIAACGGDDEGTSPATTEETTTTASTRPEDPAFEVFLLPADADDCSAVVGVPRAATVEATVEDALAQLLAGPTAGERAAGLRSWLSEETDGMLNGVVIEDGKAEVDFADFSRVIPNASSSCGSASLLAQLDQTALQFSEVDRVIYSFDGDRDAFYEWLQLSAPE